MEVARADPPPGAAGRSVRFAHLPRLRSSGLAQRGQATSCPAVKLGGRNESGGGPLPSIKVGHSGLTNTTEADAALEAYRAAREHMDALHELYVHTLCRPGANVTEARLAFDAAEREMQHYRRLWWLAVCNERMESPV